MANANQIRPKKPKRKIWKQWWFWIIIACIIVIALVSGEWKEESKRSSPPATPVIGKEVPYKVIDEEDISYLGCRRVGIRVVVPDEAVKADVNYTLGKIIGNYKSDWDDITVWAYKYSEEQQVGKIPYTMGMREYSTCE